jgi:1,2-diacylglycerol 3-alpha-glucosyltransferase
LIKSEKGKAKKDNKKALFFCFLLLNIGVVVFLGVHEFGHGAGAAVHIPLRDVRMGYLLVAVACFGVAVLTETLKYNAMLRAGTGRSDLTGAFQCAVLGKYYDNVTPLGAGGQPFQIIYLKQRGCDTGISAALPIAGFLTLQVAFSLIAAVVFVFNGKVADSIDPIRISAYVGLGFYLFVPLCIVAFAVVPKAFTRLVCGGAKLLAKVHILKDYERSCSRIIHSLSAYRESLLLLGKIPFLMVKLFACSLLYQMAILSIPFFVLRAFGSPIGWRTVFSLVVFIYAAITIAPTPGNGGAAEGSFYAVFSSLNTGCLFWAMLIWRLLVYYNWLLLGLLVLTRTTMKSKKPKKEVPQGTLRIAQFSDIFFPAVDGVVRTVDAYARRLNQLGSCCVICPGLATQVDQELPYTVIRTPSVRVFGMSYRIPLPFFPRRIKKYLKEQHFDVFHTHSPFFVGVFAMRMGRKLGVPVVATFHSKYYDDVMNLTHCKPLARLTARRIAHFYERADAVWACSAGTADTLRSYGFRGEIHVMDNGVDLVDVPNPVALREQTCQSLHLPQDKHLLLFVGQLIWQKNLRLILQVTQKLREQGEPYYTIFAGKGYDGEAIRQYAAQLGVEDSVLFVGQITNRELLDGLFLSADLFFFPSVYDNAPLVVREAALMHLPSLLTKGSNSAEHIRDGENGFLAEESCEAMTAKIQWIFANADLKRVGEHASETIPISWDVIVREVLAQYHLMSEGEEIQDGLPDENEEVPPVLATKN